MIPDPMLVLADIGSNGHMDWDGGWWIAMVVGMVIFWGLVVFGIVWLVREFGPARNADRSTTEPDAMAILDRRLAEGTVSPEEYRERRAVLRGEPSSPSDG